MYGPDGVAIIMIHKEAIHKILIANQTNTVKMLSHYYKGGSFSYPSIFAFQETIDWIDNTIYKKKEYKEKKIYFIQHIIKAIKEQNLYLCSDENSMHIVSFYSQHIHAQDLCASHFHQKKGICRISLGAYTDEEDIEKIIATIKTI
jgi:selenocysteine lyase/cysteine desulfurase